MSLRIRWKSGVAASAYQIWRNTSNDSGTASMIADDVTGSMYVDSGATPGTTYYYWLKAKNALGTSGFSSSFTALATLKPPTEAIATLLEDAGVDLSWVASAGASTYEIQRSTTEDFASYTNVGTTSGTTFSDNPPSPDVAYFYRIVAKTGGGSGHSSPSLIALGFKTISAPDIPSSVDATDNEVDQVTVSWTAAARAQVYDVYRNTSNTTTGATLIGTTEDVEYVDAPGAGSFWYFVKARNYTDSSAFSSSAAGSIFSGHLPPTGVNATDDEEGQITITWDAVSGAEFYMLYLSSTNDAGGEYAPFPGLFFVGAISAPALTVTLIAGVDLDAETTYYFFIATRIGGVDSFLSIGDSGYCQPTGGTAPGTPTGFSATDTLLDKVTCSWTPVDGATTYSVYRDGSLLASGITGSSYDDTSAAIDVNYTYYVIAVNAFGSSSGSLSDGGIRQATPYSYSFFGSGDDSETLSAVAYGYDLSVQFEAYGIADRCRVYVNGGLVFDTSCVSGTSTSSFSVNAGDVISWIVDGDCASTFYYSGWTLTIES